MAIRLIRAPAVHIKVADHVNVRLQSYAIRLNARMRVAPAAGESYVLLAKGGEDATTLCNFRLAYRNDGGTYKLRFSFMDEAGAGVQALEVAYTMDLKRYYDILCNYDNSSKIMNMYAARRTLHRDITSPTTYTLLGTTTLGAVNPKANNGYDVLIGADVSATGALQNGANADVSDVYVYAGAATAINMQSHIATRQSIGSFGRLHLFCDDGLGGRGGTTVYARVQPAGISLDGTIVGVPSWCDDPEDIAYAVGPITAGHSFIGWHSATRRPQTTITASSENAAYPATHLKNPRKAVVTRTADATGAKTWTFDFGAPISLVALYIGNHNLRSGATMTVVLDRTGTFAAPVLTETPLFFKDDIIHIFAAEYWVRYAKLTTTDDPHPDGYLELGLVDFLHGAITDTPPDLGNHEVTIADASGIVETPHADVTSRDLETSERSAVAWSAMRAGQALHIKECLDRAGGYILLLPEPSHEFYSRSVYGTVEELPTQALRERTDTFRDVGPLDVAEDF